ncbi:hypothetical protein FJT64_002512 [Amphibalanus amphitrite]|uniref:Uncharacterized protein n=1 Tax=Amphibalanus amphitrite TaxID=1232801 RepID=A0A6A4WPX4_AMPAM|nr:hypothetical protein FJT64_002512 [Amphibalanus amphitrite]
MMLLAKSNFRKTATIDCASQCPDRCLRNEYSISLLNSAQLPASYRGAAAASLRIFVSPRVEIHQEHYEYDLRRLASEFGGLLGLLAGINLFQGINHAIDALSWLADRARDRCRRPRGPGDEPAVLGAARLDVKPNVQALTKEGQKMAP